MINCEVELNNKTTFPCDVSDLQELAYMTISKAQRNCLSEKKVNISFALVDETEMHVINADYRKKDSPTDVLSFAEFEKEVDLCKEIAKDIFLGEIIICPAYIEKYAKAEKLDFQEEFWKATAHGVLHLLAYQHGEMMFSLQDAVAAKMVKNP